MSDDVIDGTGTPHESGGIKRKRVPSVLVECRDCGEEIEVDARSFDLAIEVGPGWFLCDGCRSEYADTATAGADQ